MTVLYHRWRNRNDVGSNARKLGGRLGHRIIAVMSTRAQELARDRGALLIDQFTDPASVEAHSLGTGPELLAQAGRIDAFVAAVGSGGTSVGVASCLKAHNPEILCVAVEPVGA